MSARQSQRGFTLTEMAIVVAIIGVLSTLAIVYMRPQTKAVDVATRFGDMVSEASRLAGQYGPVRADVAAANPTMGKARTYIKATTSGTSVTFALWLVLENAEPDTGTTDEKMQEYTVPKKVTAESFATSVGAYADVTPISTWNTFQLNCYPDGTCDPATLFFSQATGPTLDRQARVSIMPLGAAAYVRPDWN